MDLPADLLKKIPVGAHIPILNQIKAGYLNNENMRSLLEKKYGKEVIDQLVKDVKQAQTERVVRTELERYKLPTDLLKTVPVDSQEKVLSAIKSGNLEPQRESLEKALGKDGYKTFENNFYAAMAAAQPKELPQDLLRKNVPWKQHGDYMAKYKTGTVKDRQFILTMIGYY
ncbi:MAG: hypothetical protein IJP92_13220 [Lachnospiraceae bacterium]|nr:hypothetical protein [Lachnospiraceae bacterium]